MKSAWQIILILLILQSCNTKSTRYKVIVDNVEGLETGGHVIDKDKIIGFVTDMELFNDSVLVYFALNDGNKIPKGSKFIVQSPIFGEHNLYMEASEQRVYMTVSDTARGYRNTTKFSFGADTAGALKRKEAMQKIAEGVREFIESTRDSARRP